ncbi:MAG: DUF1294 domain-containing protein [Gammaproteobacteria bacterium]|nr:DUF1294 domain-containing protein [Gammaproteobacteria bacterium]
MLSIIVAVSFLIAVGVTVITNRSPIWILEFYLVASLVTFIVYAIDKSAARNGRWRTSERTLHAMSLFGGWPGAIFAQQKLRHKSKKRSFRILFWITAILNCGLFIWLLTPDGLKVLRALHI